MNWKKKSSHAKCLWVKKMPSTVKGYYHPLQLSPS